MRWRRQNLRTLSNLEGTTRGQPDAFTIIIISVGISQVVQRLRLFILNAGDPGWISGQGTRSHMPQLRPNAVPNVLINS